MEGRSGRTARAGTVGGVPEPSRTSDDQRRAAVLELALSERRRVHPSLVHVGTPAGPADVLAAQAPQEASALDHAVRVDQLSRLLWARRHDHPLVWLTRTGPLEWQDVDASWFSACAAASGETGVAADLLVVTRHGWWSPRTDARRTWARIRDRRRSG